MTHRLAIAAATGAAVLTLISGCASEHPAVDTSAEVHSGMPMAAGMDMAGSPAGPTGPSASARMVCSHEIHTAIARIFEQPGLAMGTPSWRPPSYTCSYALPGGHLVLSVQDSPPGPAGRHYFDRLRAADGRPDLLTGLAAFGLPSYETSSGRVVFLKDGKTLVVDAAALPKVAGPEGQSRADVAYAVAADVIGCWSE
jgi:hypothetical protein